MESLTDAPSFSEISSKVESFFDSSSVIVGHNVQFDISVLKQHLHVPYHAVIDTFPLAQTVMPFSQSYALEVLHKTLEKKKPETE